MCGLAGLLDTALINDVEGLTQLGSRMADGIAHRGPDGTGIWADSEVGLVLAHRRLAILDLSDAGHQPMISADGRFVLVYNGEIYNTDDIRRDPTLSDVAWRGHSDTEVVLESIARRGLEKTLAEMNGMFAFALWDRRTRSLQLARDRLGIKPLYFANVGTRLIFGSELKALHPAGLSRQIDPGAVAAFLRYGYVPAPFGIFQGLEKVMPGEVVTLRHGTKVTKHTYWSLTSTAAQGRADVLNVTDGEAKSQLDGLLSDAVSRQMISDVPIGAFLSGGIDSSLVVALMVKMHGGDVRTFSIGFPDLGFDESPYAAAIAQHLGTMHTDLICSADEALSLVPNLSEVYDEPFADSSQIPTQLVSALTKQSVSVALSGDGGDELFAGYNRYTLAGKRWKKVERVPRCVRSLTGRLLGAIPPSVTDALIGGLPGVPNQPGDKIAKISSILDMDAETLYKRLVSQVQDPSLYVDALEKQSPIQTPSDFTMLDRMRFMDMNTYLPDDILQKVDRASMAVSLEVRPPFLDHRVVEFAWRLPEHLLIRGGQSKWLLRQVLDRYVPSAMMDRPKMGFGVPLAQWLRGPLRDWAGDLIQAKDFGGGLLAQMPARRLWNEHQRGGRNHAYQIWTLLMFEDWRRRWTLDK